jgi:hypothetical protein
MSLVPTTWSLLFISTASLEWPPSVPRSSIRSGGGTAAAESATTTATAETAKTENKRTTSPHAECSAS